MTYPSDEPESDLSEREGPESDLPKRGGRRVTYPSVACGASSCGLPSCRASWATELQLPQTSATRAAALCGLRPRVSCQLQLAQLR